MPFYVKPAKIITRRCFRDFSATVNHIDSNSIHDRFVIFTADVQTNRLILHTYNEQLEIQPLRDINNIESTFGTSIFIKPTDILTIGYGATPIKVLCTELPQFYRWRFILKKNNQKGLALCSCSSSWQIGIVDVNNRSLIG